MKTLHHISLLRFICGSLFVASTANAQQNEPDIRCPGLYYESPWNLRVIVPQGCPPNEATRQQNPYQNPSSNTTQMPLPDTQSNAVATIIPKNGTVDVKLNNTTNAVISYQALGHTEPRPLVGQSEYTLRNLPLPVTITLVREDDGLLRILPVSTSQSEMLEVNIDEETSLDSVQGTIRIQGDGQVFLN